MGDIAPRGRGRPLKTQLTAEQLLSGAAVLTLMDVAVILGVDRSTVLRKERQGLLPKRRSIAGHLVFRTSEIRALIDDAAAVDGPDADHSARSRKAREIALARGAGNEAA